MVTNIRLQPDVSTTMLLAHALQQVQTHHRRLGALPNMWNGGSILLCPQVWEVRSKKLKLDLPGHADEVYAVDWSPDGAIVASGGKDRVIKLWKS